jgi:hypothetical protein
MDPDHAYSLMMDASADPADRADAADALADWIDAGGFLPGAPWSTAPLAERRRLVLAECRSIARTMDQRIRMADEHARMAAARAEQVAR